eukprot:6455204-Amphidinium_carterae.1
MTPEEAFQLGHVNERQRFHRRYLQVGARENVVYAECPQEKATWNPCCKTLFPVVPRSFIEAKHWKLAGRHKWEFPCSSMPLLEGHATLYGLRHLLRSTSNFGKRLVVLGDSSSVALATAKGRSSSHGLGRLLRQICALCLSSFLFIDDGPSRGDWLPSRPQDLKREDACPQAPPHGRASEAQTSEGSMSEVAGHDLAPTAERHSSHAEVVHGPLTKFHLWLKRKRLTSKEHWDKAISQYLEQMFIAGDNISMANKMVAAILWKDPSISPGGVGAMPLTRQSLKGWKRIRPACRRHPLPVPVVKMMIMRMLQLDEVIAALYVYTLLETYCRPSEPLRLRPSDMIPPCPKAGAAHRHAALLLHPTELRQPAKNHQWDET